MEYRFFHQVIGLCGTDIVDVVFDEEGRRFDGKIFQENQDRSAHVANVKC